MLIITQKIKDLMCENNLTLYKFAKLVNYNSGGLSCMINGKDAFPEKLIKRICNVLGVSKGEFLSWIVADKYSKDEIQTAFNELKNRKDKETLILTQNIDKILTEKNISRTELSKQINYSQSGLNRMIIGQISMSQSVISRVTPILSVSEETIKGWIIADKYYLKVFKLALDLKSNEN